MSTRIRAAVALGAAALLSVAVVPFTLSLPASAVAVTPADAPTYKVTYVALSCDDYTDVMANRARNNLQESLKDLGQDTTYNAGDPVRPSVENAVPTQAANCTPLTDWRLTLGQGYKGKTQASLYLSTVTSPYSTNIVTQPSTPELDSRGNPTGRTLQGAVTVDLTAAQAQRAQQGNSLWVQGGTPSQPLNGKQDEFGFAALRCSIDNLNGDNAEWIGYSGQATHTFCYYFAVKPPPQSSAIVVRKALETGTSGPASFRFVGNISYTTATDFFLTPQSSTSPAQTEFIRAAGTEWDFEEQPSEGFVPTGPPVCVSQGGSGVSLIAIVGQKVTVNPSPGSRITCTYTNRADVTGPLQLSKVTKGGVGTFDFDVTFPSPPAVNYDVTTTQEGVPETVVDIPSGPTGDYSVTENLPADTPKGTWDLTGASCNGNPQTVTGTTFGGTVGTGQAVDCVVENTFTPGGSLAIRKTTLGGVGTFGYSVQQIDLENEVLTGESAELTATTVAEDTAVDAIVGPDSTLNLDALPVDEPTSAYAITELLPPASDEGHWVVDDISCTGTSVEPPILNGAFVIVTIREQEPDVECDFTNRFVPSASLIVTKIVDGPASARQGPAVIDLTCSDKTAKTLTVAKGVTEKSLPELLFFTQQGIVESVDCTVEETATGVAPGATVDTGILAVVDGEVVGGVDGRSVDFTLEPGDVVEIVVANIFTAADTGGGSGGGTGEGDTGGSGSQLPDTGASEVATAAQTGLLIALIGFVIIAMARTSRRWAW